MAIEAASVAAAECANKRRLMALDVRNDALGRVGTIRTLIELLGRHPGSLACRRWRDASRGLALTEGGEECLVRAVAADHTNPRLLANLGFYDVTRLNLNNSGPYYSARIHGLNPDTTTDAAVVALAKGCRNVVSVDLTCCKKVTSVAVIALATACPKLTTLKLYECASLTDDIAAIPVLANLTALDIGTSHKISDAGALKLMRQCPNLASIALEELDITNATLRAIATEFPGLASLNLINCQGPLSEAGFTAFATGNHDKFTSIDLSCCSELNVNAFATSLAAGCRNLTSVGLCHSCDLLTEAGVAALVSGCRNLVALDHRRM